MHSLNLKIPEKSTNELFSPSVSPKSIKTSIKSLMTDMLALKSPRKKVDYFLNPPKDFNLKFESIEQVKHSPRIELEAELESKIKKVRKKYEENQFKIESEKVQQEVIEKIKLTKKSNKMKPGSFVTYENGSFINFLIFL